jgi:aspartyl-tRNA(Asn)/glutamyl-tRNA(Gln) amidotransferase subunit A
MQTIEALARDLEEGRTTARALVEQSLERIADPAGEGASTFLAVHTEARGARRISSTDCASWGASRRASPASRCRSRTCSTRRAR